MILHSRSEEIPVQTHLVLTALSPSVIRQRPSCSHLRTPGAPKRKPPMARMSSSRRLIIALCGAISIPAVSGCLTPYAIPHVHSTPAIAPAIANDQVHAFRVERRDYYVRRFLMFPPTCTTFEIREIQPDSDGNIPAQRELSFNRGLGVPGLLLFRDGMHVIHHMRTILYRPGFGEVFVQGANDIPEPMKPVTTLAEEVNALDRLASIASQPRRFPVSQEHRKVILFIASEYDRLATAAASIDLKAAQEVKPAKSESHGNGVTVGPEKSVDSNQLSEKAAAMRKLADKQSRDDSKDAH